LAAAEVSNNHAPETPTLEPVVQSQAAEVEKKEQFFPYPKEYAPPPDTENDEHEEDVESYEEPDQPTAATQAIPAPSIDQLVAELPETKAYNEANAKLSNLRAKRTELDEFLSANVGSEGEFTVLFEFGKRRWLSDLQNAVFRTIDNSGVEHATCLEYESGEYKYELCPFVGVTQKNAVGGHRVAGLGNWKGWKDGKMDYSGGDSCWNGPQRSCLVRIFCLGGTDAL
jgi:protein kinase C substrate 80K-H